MNKNEFGTYRNSYLSQKIENKPSLKTSNIKRFAKGETLFQFYCVPVVSQNILTFRKTNIFIVYIKFSNINFLKKNLRLHKFGLHFEECRSEKRLCLLTA
jgi:hypothetical protein